MSINTKAKGTRNEHRSIQLLEAAGYRCTRAAASLGAWDVAGIDRGYCATPNEDARWPGTVEIEALKLLAAPANCRKVVRRWRNRRRLPDVKEL